LTAALALACLGPAARADAAALRVVTTLSDYASFAARIGGERVQVSYIVEGNQDAHFIRPKPSFVDLVRGADVFVATGLDLELWVPPIVDRSGNRRVRSGERGYVAASQGMRLLEKPTVLSRAEGGVHIHGNPHLTNSPINMKVAARNIAAGLAKNDPAGEEEYAKNLLALEAELDQRLFGPELVKLLGGPTLCQLAEKGALIPFLRNNSYRGKLLMDSLGGWLGQMMPLRGARVVTYHKNWVYFLHLFGMQEVGTIEPKPGIPPSPRHVRKLIATMREQNVRLLLAANYFDEHKVRTVASAVGAQPVIVPLYVDGAAGVEDYFKLVDHWVGELLRADAASRQ